MPPVTFPCRSTPTNAGAPASAPLPRLQQFHGRRLQRRPRLRLVVPAHLRTAAAQFGYGPGEDRARRRGGVALPSTRPRSSSQTTNATNAPRVASGSGNPSAAQNRVPTFHAFAYVSVVLAGRSRRCTWSAKSPASAGRCATSTPWRCAH